MGTRDSQNSDPGSQDTPKNQDASGDVNPRDTDQVSQSGSCDSNAAVRAEAVRVKAKFAYIDASNDVVLRFDFMNESDTRVKAADFCCNCIMPICVFTPLLIMYELQVASYVILAATLLGLAVLIAEFVNKIKSVRACYVTVSRHASATVMSMPLVTSC